jgi:hypothetical protein
MSPRRPNRQHVSRPEMRGVQLDAYGAGQPLMPPSIENVCDVTIALSSLAR